MTTSGTGRKPFLLSPPQTPYPREVPLKILIPLAIMGSFLFVGLFILSHRFAIMLILIAIGFTMVWKTPWFLDFFGRVRWAEEHLSGGGLGAGMGGSWLWYKLLGVLVIVGAILYMTGALQSLLTNVLGTFFSSGLVD